jgi:hypothetical protein
VNLEIDMIRERLDAIAAHLAECRAAAETMAEGDPSAAAELSAEVDAMAAEVAALKAASTTSAKF